MRVCNLGCLVITLVWQSHVKPSLCWSPTARLPVFLPASSCFPHLAPLTLSFLLSLPLAMALNAPLQSASISQKVLPAVCSVPPPLIWQAWNIEENVNICFLVTGQVYEIHLYWWMQCQGFDGGCVWSCGDLFYPKSTLFWSVNVTSVCVCVWKSKRENQCLCVYIIQDLSLCVPKNIFPNLSPNCVIEGLVGNFHKGKCYFSLKHQYPHAELIKSTLVRQETGYKTQHMETVRLLWFRSSIWAFQWI